MNQRLPDDAFESALRHHQAGRLPQAEELYRQILAQQPNHADALHLSGLIQASAGRYEAAAELMARAVAVHPGFAVAWCNLGNAYSAMGKGEEAIAAFGRAIALNPADAEAHYNLANVLKDLGHHEQAIASYRRAIAIRREFPHAHCNLGAVLRKQDRLDEAIEEFRRAIAIKWAYPLAHYNLGNAFKDSGQLDAAISAYRQAIKLDPNYLEADSNLIYTLEFHPAFDAASIAAEQGRWNRQHAQPLQTSIPAHGNDPSPDRRLRIGYVSPNFNDHVVGRNLLPLLRRHNREAFEIFCYAQVPDGDAITQQFQQTADHWCNTVGLSDSDLAGQIRRDRIDILVDLTLHMAGNRLLVFARKPAPIQVTFAGYPGSTGLSAIDYRLSDPYLEAAGMDESLYSEQTIQLADSFWCFDPLGDASVPVNDLPALRKGFITFGCLNNFCKINDQVLAVWAGVLRSVEKSRLLMLAPEGSHRQRTVQRLAGEGIDAQRIEFVARQHRRGYLELYHRIDIALDTFPYNGHTTSLEALWMGVPLVTLVGQRPVARAGWCQLSNLQLTELAAQSPEQFVKIATELAGDLPRLSSLRANLRGRMERSPLMDADRFARSVEAAYRQMWHRWCQAPAER